MPWPQLTATFKTSSDPSPASAPLIAQNTTLEQDKATLLACWLAIGGKEDKLKGVYYDRVDKKTKMTDEPSDDMSEWFQVTVM